MGQLSLPHTQESKTFLGSAGNLLALRRGGLWLSAVLIVVMLRAHLLPLLLLRGCQDVIHLRHRALTERLNLFVLLILGQRRVVADSLNLLMLLLKNWLELVLLILREIQLPGHVLKSLLATTSVMMTLLLLSGAGRRGL